MVHATIVSLRKPGCVRGLHGRGQGQRSSRPRPRPDHFGSRPRTCKSYMISEVVRGGREETAESTPQTEQATVANVSTHDIKHHYSSKFNVLRPDLEAKAKAARHQDQGRGQGSLRPRPQNFVLEVSSRSMPVLEDPIPAPSSFYSRFKTHLFHKSVAP